MYKNYKWLLTIVPIALWDDLEHQHDWTTDCESNIHNALWVDPKQMAESRWPTDILGNTSLSGERGGPINNLGGGQRVFRVNGGGGGGGEEG